MRVPSLAQQYDQITLSTVEALQRLESFVVEHAHFKLWIWPTVRRGMSCILGTMTRTNEPRTPNWLRLWWMEHVQLRVLHLLMAAMSWLPPALALPAGCFLWNHGGCKPKSFVARSHEVFNVLGGVPIVHEEMEYSVPLADARATLERLLQIAEAYPVLFPQEVRVGKADDMFLSTDYGPDAGVRVQITVMRFESGCDNAFFNEVEAMFKANPRARPHWGKHHSMTAAELAPRFERWADFQRIRDITDPKRVFTTPYVAHVFGK